MKQTVLFAFFFLTLSSSLRAQPGILDGLPQDSLVFSFGLNDSLMYHAPYGRVAAIDTTNTTLWDIGTTVKSFFAQGGATRALMTDTFNTYPVNANDWFTLTLTNGNNTIITFDHKYETTAGHDGGMVEFSKDGGQTWENVKGECNIDNMLFAQGIHTTNFYDTTDTLNSGDMAFSSTSNGWQTSRIQFFWGIPIKTTGTGGHDCVAMNTIMLRFRFVSDDTLENKDGWIIDNIKVEYDKYVGVTDVEKAVFKVYPNPATNVVHFPAIPNESRYSIEITDMLGKCVLKTAYHENLDLRKQPRGLYFYKITDGETLFTGKLQLQ